MPNVNDLREHLFETLKALRDEKNPMDLERAKTISTVAQTIINSAKVECDFIEAAGIKGSGFIPDENRAPQLRKLTG